MKAEHARMIAAQSLEELAEGGRYRRLVGIAVSEPPRVRAMLGAIGERLGGHGRAAATLRRSLIPLSRFGFGMFANTSDSRDWQGEERP